MKRNEMRFLEIYRKYVHVKLSTFRSALRSRSLTHLSTLLSLSLSNLNSISLSCNILSTFLSMSRDSINFEILKKFDILDFVKKRSLSERHVLKRIFEDYRLSLSHVSSYAAAAAAKSSREKLFLHVLCFLF